MSDLTAGKERPLWPLSSYGPHGCEPALLSGLDQSPEELRVKATAAMKAGNVGEYLSYESSKIAAAEQAFSNAINNPNQAHEQAMENHRVAAPSAAAEATTIFVFSSGGTSAFGGASGASAFGRSSFGPPAFGQSQAVFGAPESISASEAPASTSAFGKPATFVNQTSTFGQAAQSSAIKPAFAGSAASVFGLFGDSAGDNSASSGGSESVAKPATLGRASMTGGAVAAGSASPAFGAPVSTSAFGTPASTSRSGAPASTSLFGAPASTSVFDAPALTSTFGTPASTSLFGTPVSTSSTSIFGVPPPASQSKGKAAKEEYVYVSLNTPTETFCAISAALNLSTPAIGLLGRVPRTIFDDWLCGITELHAEANRDRELRSEAEQLLTELAESLEEINKGEQERDAELARYQQQVRDQQSEIERMSSQLEKRLEDIETVKHDWDIMEKARNSEQMRRLELEERVKARQAEEVILRDDLAKCRETVQKLEQERDLDLARLRQEILDQRSEVESMSRLLDEVKKERQVMEMEHNSAVTRRLQLAAEFREQQAAAVVLQKDLEQARGRCSELEAELQRTKANEQARKDEEIADRNEARAEGRDDMLTEMIRLLNSKRENERRAKQAEKDRVEKERSEKMRKAERERAEELERSRCLNRDAKYRNAISWTEALAFERFETILLVEEFAKIKFCESKPLTFEALPWPVLARPGTYTADRITAEHVRAFFRTTVATSAKSITHPIPAEYRKHLVKQGLLAFHEDKMVARISTVDDEALRKQISEAANTITQTLNEIMQRM